VVIGVKNKAVTVLIEEPVKRGVTVIIRKIANELLVLQITAA
jgi:hypothetical protein